MVSEMQCVVMQARRRDIQGVREQVWRRVTGVVAVGSFTLRSHDGIKIYNRALVN